MTPPTETTSCFGEGHPPTPGIGGGADGSLSWLATVADARARGRMPIYEYACEKCKREFEVEQRITDDPLKSCPKCRSRKVKRLISRTSFVLKGSGWYSDLYSSAKPKTSGESESAKESASDSKSKSDTKSDGKSDPKKKKKDKKSSKAAA